MGSRALPRLAFLFGTIGLVVLIAGGAARRVEAADAVIYGDSLASGWRNWSWRSTVAFSATPGYNGSARAISWQVTSGGGGLYLHTDSGVPTTSSTRLRFAVRAGQADQRFKVGLYDASGTLLTQKRLFEVGGDPPAGAWKAYDISLGTLGAAGKSIEGFQLQDAENAAQATVLVDDVKLVNTGGGAPLPPPPLATDNLVANASLEQPQASDPARPQFWSTARSGDNDARFSYLTSGRSGSRSVRIDITQRTSGAAAWVPAAWPVVAGQAYRIVHHYQSSGRTWAVAAVRKADGTTEYVGRKQAPPSSSWAQYTDSFIAPAGAVSLSVSHEIGSVGFLVTDDYSVTPLTPRPFSRALVSLTFDDGYKSQISSAWPLLRQYGMPATFFVASGLLGGSSTYMAPADVATLARDGAHIASHTISHPDLTTLSAQQVANELAGSRQSLEDLLGRAVADFASPQGRYGGSVYSQIRQVYRSHRSVVTGYNLRDTLDPYAIQVQNIYLTTTDAEVRSWVQQAARHRSWLVLVYHRVDSSGDRFSLTPPALERHLKVIQAEGIAVATLDQALRETTAQP